MSNVLARYPTAVREIIESRLADDETVIWAGRPMLRHAWTSREQPAPGEHTPLQVTSAVGRVLEECLALVVSLLLVPIGGAIAAYGLVQSRAAEGLPGIVAHAPLLLTGVALVVAGACGLFAPIRGRLEAVRTYYVLTDRRALLLRHGSGRAFRMARTAAALLVYLIGLAAAVVVTVIGMFWLTRVDVGADGVLDAFLFGAGCLFVLLGSGLLVARSSWIGLTRACGALLQALRGEKLTFELRIFEIDDLDLREIRVKRTSRHGVGDLVFANDDYYDRDGSENVGGGAVEVDVGFLSVDAAREVEKVLRRIRSERVAA